MAEPKALLLSIQPRHADAIMTGRKTVEVRRRRVSAPVGTTVILYATAPVKAVVATARLSDSVVCSPEATWSRFSAALGLARHELDAYLDGADGCLLFLTDVLPLDAPLSLDELRRSQPFQPPQSYRFVKGEDPSELRLLPNRPADRPWDSVADHGMGRAEI